jgi:hypothetical protein
MRLRRQAIGLLEQDVPVHVVAQRLGVDRRSVRRWKRAFRRRGDAGLAARPAAGRPSKLTARQCHTLVRWILGGAEACGYPTALWTCRRIARVSGNGAPPRSTARSERGWMRTHDGMSSGCLPCARAEPGRAALDVPQVRAPGQLRSRRRGRPFNARSVVNGVGWRVGPPSSRASFDTRLCLFRSSPECVTAPVFMRPDADGWPS